MMDVKNLMVGDYLQLEGLAYRVIQIDGIVRDGFMLENGMEDYGEPIPLTKDILWRNFPDTLGNVYWIWDDEKSNEEENWYEFSISGKNVKVNMEIRYVHELQHALRLCGINKEIEL